MAGDEGRKGTSNRGFASMDRTKQREIASKGGQSVPPEKRSFSQDPKLAAQAGRKGGESVPPQGRSFSQNRGLAAEAGRKGGQSRGAAARTAQANGAGDKTGEAHRGGKTAPRAEDPDDDEAREDLRGPRTQFREPDAVHPGAHPGWHGSGK